MTEKGSRKRPTDKGPGRHKTAGLDEQWFTPDRAAEQLWCCLKELRGHAVEELANSVFRCAEYEACVRRLAELKTLACEPAEQLETAQHSLENQFEEHVWTVVRNWAVRHSLENPNTHDWGESCITELVAEVVRTLPFTPGESAENVLERVPRALGLGKKHYAVLALRPLELEDIEQPPETLAPGLDRSQMLEFEFRDFWHPYVSATDQNPPWRNETRGEASIRIRKRFNECLQEYLNNVSKQVRQAPDREGRWEPFRPFHFEWLIRLLVPTEDGRLETIGDIERSPGEEYLRATAKRTKDGEPVKKEKANWANVQKRTKDLASFLQIALPVPN